MKNRFLITIATISYLGFYLFSPLFHFHHNDPFHDTHQEYHSHLFNDLSNNKMTDGSHHSFEKESEHVHKLIINSVIATYSTRYTEPETGNATFSDFVDTKFENLIRIAKIYFDFSISRIQWEKCVHSASNVSPPSKFLA